MSVNSDNLKRSNSEQLAEFKNRLESNMGDGKVLAKIKVVITGLLSNGGGSESRIRDILQKRFDSGDLRPEKFKLVQKMLDRILAEVVSTLPADSALPFNGVPAVAGAKPTEKIMVNGMQVGPVLAGRFLLQQQVFVGSMGVVFKAIDRRLAEDGDTTPNIGIKVLSSKLSRNDKAMRALQQEMAKGRCLTHKNIVRYIDLKREGDFYFIVMERLEGNSLQSILDESGTQKIHLIAAMDIVTQISRTLEFAHQRGIVHADVKPGNIMITPTGDAKLFDFGAARVRQKEQEVAPDNDADETGANPPAYSSMQVLTGEEPVPADDVFSLACLLYRLVAGYRVFGPRNAAEAAAEGMEPQKPKGLSETQWQALKKALAYSRVPRFASAAAFVAALDGVHGTQAAPPVKEETVIVEEHDDEPRRSPWRLAVLGIILIASVGVALQTDLLEKLEQLAPLDAFNTMRRLSEQLTAGSEPVSEMTQSVADEVPIATMLVGEFVDEPVEIETQVEPKIDFAALLPPTLTVGLAATDQFISEVDLTLREDSDAATLDLVRMNNILQSYSVQLKEVGFSGNQSPWESGQYQITNDGLIEFAAGQSRARTTISMRSDSRREPDQQVTIQIRETDDAGSELARIKIFLEDDDQRIFEAGMPQNTISFAVSQVSVREVDSAVQIDVLRYHTDNSAIEVSYAIRDVTATAGEDYFPPEMSVVKFGRGQRSTRILIPLVQDAYIEIDEAFIIELVNIAPTVHPDIYHRITVMIRDDD